MRLAGVRVEAEDADVVAVRAALDRARVLRGALHAVPLAVLALAEGAHVTARALDVLEHDALVVRAGQLAPRYRNNHHCGGCY